MRATIACKDNLGKLCLVLRASRMSQRPVDRRGKYNQQRSKQGACNNVNRIVITQIDGGESDQRGENTEYPEQRGGEFARAISAHDRYCHMPAGEAVILKSLHLIYGRLKKVEQPQSLQRGMLGNIAHKVGPPSGNRDIPEIGDEECCHYQKGAIAKLRAGSLIPVQYAQNNY